MDCFNGCEMKKLLIVGCLMFFSWAASAQQDSVVPAVEDLMLESLEERMVEVEDAADFSDEVKNHVFRKNAFLQFSCKNEFD